MEKKVIQKSSLELENIEDDIKIVAYFMGWKYQYENMLIAHGANSFFVCLLCTKYPLDIDDNEPNVVHYDSVYGYKCSLLNSEFIYILDRERTKSYLIHNSLLQECNYNSSWDRLVPVIQKIFSLPFIEDSVMILKWADVNLAWSRKEIGEIWESCVRFIKWYNTQKEE